MTFRIRAEQQDELAKSNVSNVLSALLGQMCKSAHYDPNRSAVCVDGHREQRTWLQLGSQGELLSVSTPLGRATRYGYRGALITSTQLPAGLVITSQYDAVGRIIRTEQSDGEILALAYDARGNVSQISTGDGSVLRLDFDAQQRLQHVTERDGGETHRTYDDQGRLTSVVDPLGRQTSLSYGTWLDPDRIEQPDGTVFEYKYEDGYAKELVDGAERAEYWVDANGKLTKAVYQDGWFLSYVWDNAGKLKQATSVDCEVAYDYDEDGRLISETQVGGVVRYDYDDDGQLTHLYSPDGRSVAFDYDLDGRVSAVTDWSGARQHFSYGAAEHPTARKLPSGGEERYSLDLAGRVTAISLEAGGQTLWTRRYERDTLGQIREQADSMQGLRRYSYDSLGRLVRAEDGGNDAIPEYFSYDVASQRAQTPSGTTSFDNMCRPVSQGVTGFAYDQLGNRTREKTPGGTCEYTWIGPCLLRKALVSSGVIRYEYDALGRRVRKWLGDSSITYVWAGHTLIQEIHDGAAGKRTVDYLYLPGSHTPIAKCDDGRVYYYHCDQLGTPLYLTDSSLRLVWSARYEDFGLAHIDLELVEQPLRLPGQYFDAETKLHYNRSRYYDPRLGVYLSRDPLAPAGDNAYLYVGANPINGADPMGLFWESKPGWFKTAVTIAAGVGVGLLVGAAVVAFAPAALALGTVAAISVLAGGIAGGAAAGGLDAAMTVGGCVWCGIGKGAVLGGIAALPFAFAPAAAGYGLVAGLGAIGGAASYAADCLAFGHKWDTGEFVEAVALSAALTVAGKFVMGRLIRGRAVRITEAADKPLEPTNPNKSTEGHGHADHGAQTTEAQQGQRIKDGTTPSGRQANAPSKTSKFNSPEQEAEALRLGRKGMDANAANGYPPYDPVTGEPNRCPVDVTTNDPEGFGSQTTRAKNPDGTNMRDANGDYVPVTNPTPLSGAKIIYEYVPSTGKWEPVTYYPQ